MTHCIKISCLNVPPLVGCTSCSGENMSFAKTLGAWEKEHCISGKLPKSSSLNQELYIFQVHQWNARKSEAIALTEKVHSLLKARSFIMRGKLNSASTILKTLRENSGEDLEPTEILLEEARVANAHGEWSLAVKLATDAIDSGPSAVSALTLYQIRALALFEQGNFSSALRDLENAESLCEIFPKSSAGFYARVSKARLLARTRGLETGRIALDALWKEEQLDNDLVLTLLRAEIDIRRLEKRRTLECSAYSYHVAHRLGDLLYSNLALVDIYYSVSQEDRVSIQTSIQQAKSEFIRIQKLCDEIESESPASTTAQTIRRYAERSETLGRYSQVDLKNGATAFLIPESSNLFHFELNRVFKIEYGKVGDALLLLIRNSRIKKSDFFSHLWGAQKYSPRLHDNLIWNLLTRMRKSLSIDLTVEDETVVLKSKIWRLSQ